MRRELETAPRYLQYPDVGRIRPCGYLRCWPVAQSKRPTHLVVCSTVRGQYLCHAGNSWIQTISSRLSQRKKAHSLKVLSPKLRAQLPWVGQCPRRTWSRLHRGRQIMSEFIEEMKAEYPLAMITVALAGYMLNRKEGQRNRVVGCEWTWMSERCPNYLKDGSKTMFK